MSLAMVSPSSAQMLLLCLRMEVYKMARRWRTYLGFLAMGLLMLPILYSLRSGSPFERAVREGMSSSFLVMGTPFNGAFFSWLIMRTVMRLVPFFVVLVGGEAVAGEAATGTLRTVLTRPLSREVFLTAKFLAVLLFTTVLVLFVGAFSMGLGSLFLGWGNLWVPEKGVWFFGPQEGFWRLVGAYLLVVWGTYVVAALAFFLSTLVENPLGPAIGALAITIGFWTLETVETFTDSPWLHRIKPFLFTTHFDVWKVLFDDPIPWGQVARSSWICGGHVVGFYLLALWIFRRKDWTC